MKKLFVVGMGPGNPRDVTIRAVETLKSSEVIFVPGSERDRSIARSVLTGAFEILGLELPELRDLLFPMTRDRTLNRKAWLDNAEEIAEAVSLHGKVSYAVLGNPLFYSTFGNIIDMIHERSIEIEYIPGLSSIDSCASAASINLGSGDESIGIFTYRKIVEINDPGFDTIIVLKVPSGSRSLEMLKHRFPGYGRVVYARRCSMNDQLITEVPMGEEGDYFSMVIMRR